MDWPFPAQTQWLSPTALSLMKARQQRGEAEKSSILYSWSVKFSGLTAKSPTHPVIKGTLDELISSDSQSRKLLDSLGSFSLADFNSPLAGVCILCSCKHGRVWDVI